jgi:hypothetical protein
VASSARAALAGAAKSSRAATGITGSSQHDRADFDHSYSRGLGMAGYASGGVAGALLLAPALQDRLDLRGFDFALQ